MDVEEHPKDNDQRHLMRRDKLDDDDDDADDGSFDSSETVSRAWFCFDSSDMVVLIDDLLIVCIHAFMHAILHAPLLCRSACELMSTM